MKKKLYCDIDSTINNHHERIRRWTLPSWPGKKIHPNAFTVIEVMKDKPAFGSQKAIKKLSQKYEIHWISTRPPHLESATIAWLQKYNYPIGSLTLVDNMMDKPDFLKSQEVDIFIDDFLTNHEKAKTKLRYDVIKKLDRLQIKYEIFDPISNNWERIVKKLMGAL